MPFLGSFSPVLPKTLQRNLARHPEFFIECLETLFYAKSEALNKNDSADDVDSDDAAVGDARTQRARQIFHLLREWRIIPGSDVVNGTVALDDLRAWVTKARELARQVDRIEVCDITIGELFGKSPFDTDGGLPLIALREMIEECASEDLESGFCTGLFNRRGVTMRGPYAGGQQERELAEKYENYAQICGSWPRTAAVLKSMAKSYLRQAQREDEEAEARK